MAMNVAILNARSSLTNAARLYDSHAMYVASAVAAARKRWTKTGGRVWLVGTSNGTISAFNLAARTASNAPVPLIAYRDRSSWRRSRLANPTGWWLWGTDDHPSVQHGPADHCRGGYLIRGIHALRVTPRSRNNSKPL